MAQDTKKLSVLVTDTRLMFTKRRASIKSLVRALFAILFTPPLIPAGIRRNPPESRNSGGMDPESAGIQEFRRIPAGMEQEWSRNRSQIDQEWKYLIPAGFHQILDV